MSNKLSMTYIVTSEDSVLRTERASESLHVAVDLLYRASDVVLRLMYDLGPPVSPETSEGMYRGYAFERFGEVPYTVRAIHLLSARGHYPESVALVRLLMESFVQLRYFERHPDQLKPHLLATSARGRVRFVTMFDELAPGSYGGIYSLLSSIAHSGMGLSALLPYQSPTEDQLGRTLGRHGCEFDEKAAALVVNMTAATLRGFLDHFDTFFPTGKPSDLLTFERRGLIQILAQFVNMVISGEMLSHVLKLTALTPTEG